VEISCLEVIRELSNYIDKDVTQRLREQITAHLPGCSHCIAVYDGLRNTITLTGDGRAFDLPAGFSQRFRAKLTGLKGRLPFSPHSTRSEPFPTLRPIRELGGRASANGPVKFAF
jgi:hypothetical protein